MNTWKLGDRVIVNDYSEAHGDHGEIHEASLMSRGMYHILLDEGGIWPCVMASELTAEDSPIVATVCRAGEPSTAQDMEFRRVK